MRSDVNAKFPPGLQTGQMTNYRVCIAAILKTELPLFAFETLRIEYIPGYINMRINTNPMPLCHIICNIEKLDIFLASIFDVFY